MWLMQLYSNGISGVVYNVDRPLIKGALTKLFHAQRKTGFLNLLKKVRIFDYLPCVRPLRDDLSKSAETASCENDTKESASRMEAN